MYPDNRMVAKISGKHTCLLPPIVNVRTLRDALKVVARVMDDIETVWIPVQYCPKGRVFINLNESVDLKECSDFILKPVNPEYVNN